MNKGNRQGRQTEIQKAMRRVADGKHKGLVLAKGSLLDGEDRAYPHSDRDYEIKMDHPDPNRPTPNNKYLFFIIPPLDFFSPYYFNTCS